MGIYLNPGNGMFQESLNGEIYVDKSGVIACTNKVLKTREKYLCVSRPRRFGKSMTLDMLAAYYCRTCDSRKQFAGLAIEGDASFERHLNKYNVIKVVMNDFLFGAKSDVNALINRLESRLVRELEDENPDVRLFDDDRLTDALATVYAKTGIPFVILIDEWDCVMREMQDDEDAQRAYLDWLRLILKDKEYVALAYATGILPVKKYGAHSALNMFAEISVLDARDFAPYTGFTEGEVEALAQRFGMDMDEVRRWYDGYDINGIATYNPRSVVMSMTGSRFGNYWTQTETFEALRRYIVLDMDGLHEKVTTLIGGGEVPVNTAKFQNTMNTFGSADDVLTLLIHLGYLTYDMAKGMARVPNQEVAGEFVNCIEDGGWESVAHAIAESESLMQALVARDGNRVAELVERAHEENSSILKYNDENTLACVLSLALYTARKSYTVEREAPAGKGYADLVFRPRRNINAPGFVVELKAGGTPEEAIAQIRERGYMRALEGCPGSLAVGIVYDRRPESPSYKTHRCVIEPIAL